MEIDNINNNLQIDICKLVEEAKSFATNTANKTISIPYSEICQQINNELLEGKCAEYEKQTVTQLAKILSSSHFIKLFSLKLEM